jgi:hypothetical protein
MDRNKPSKTYYNFFPIIETADQGLPNFYLVSSLRQLHTTKGTQMYQRDLPQGGSPWHRGTVEIIQYGAP